MANFVEFNYALWQARYPELASVPVELATLYFDEAGLYLANDGSGPVRSQSEQLTLLNMLTAHIAKMNATINGQAPSGLVGKISSASEGSVSVSVESLGEPGTAAWYQQTTYGAAFWALTTKYRSFRYRGRHGRNFGTPGSYLR